jgi:Zn finger protein HypA/HybF involved in hydrogenase expression
MRGIIKMANQVCHRCTANLTNGYCEYCGWNASEVITDKILTLSGLLSHLTVTKDTCTFAPRVGAPTVIMNREISQISLLQAPVVGSGELSLLTVTGITQKISFLYPQNPNMQEIASYLLHVAPDAKFVNVSTETTSASIQGVACPKCKSNNTNTTGESRKFSVWKIIVGALLVISGIGSMSGGVAISLVIITGGLVLAANGFSIIGKRKLDCLCLNCRSKFRV